MNEKLISIELFADFGMLKKPDTNEPVYLTFNMLHKPVLLGILGAIIGLEGFKEKGKLPEYYEKLKDLKIGIEPLKHEKGNYQKTTIAYNNTTGMASKEQGGNLIVTEQTLIAPAFRCYFLLDLDKSLHQKIDKNLSSYTAEFLPYLGKNEFSIWWERYQTYKNIEDFDFSKEFKVGSLFYKDAAVSNHIAKALGRAMRKELKNRFVFFERLPVAYNEELFQYNYSDFVFTNAIFNTELELDSLKVIDNQTIIQLI